MQAKNGWGLKSGKAEREHRMVICSALGEELDLQYKLGVRITPRIDRMVQ